MRKRLIAFVFAIACIASAVSCGAKNETSKDNNENSSESSTSTEVIDDTTKEFTEAVTEEATEPATEKEKKSVKQYEKRHFNADGSILYREDYYYNDDNQLEEYLLWNAFDGSTVISMLHIEYEYDDSGKLIKSTRHFTDNKDGQALMYDLEKKEGFYKYGFGYGKEEEDGYYYSVDEYNDEGWITSTKRYSTSGDTLLSEINYGYEDKTTEWDNGLMGPKTIGFSIYDGLTDSFSETFTDYNGPEKSWSLYQSNQTNQHNSAGQTDYFNNDGTIAYTTTYDGTEQYVGGESEGDCKKYEIRYTFDEYDNILTEKKYLITGEKEVFHSASGSSGSSSSNSSTEETTKPPKMTLQDIEEYGTLDSYVEYKYEYR